MGLYSTLIHAEGDGEEQDLAESARPHVARNGLREIAAQSLQGVGDQVVNAKTVLPWLMSAVAAPSGLLAFLVPIREAGSMLPQAALTPWVRRLRARKWAWVAGGVGQALATVALAVAALSWEGWTAGLVILAALAVFALGRALCSLASKDVLGRTVPKGQRGQINGIVTVLSGVVALAMGLVLELWVDVDATVVAVLLLASAVAWILAILIYATVREPRGEPMDPEEDEGWVLNTWHLLRDDATFRRFVWVRSLLLVSALSPPFVVALAVANGGDELSGLGLFILAQGVAQLIGGRLFGLWADRSSRLLMVWCSAAASAVIAGFLLLSLVPDLEASLWLHPATYLLLALVHLGTRVARKTYVVDVAEGDRRTEYVAVANTAMGVLLLGAGGITAVLALWDNEAALILLAALGVLGALLGRSLPEVSAGTP